MLTKVTSWDGRTLKTGQNVQYRDQSLGILGQHKNGKIVAFLSANLAMVKWPFCQAPVTEFIPNLRVQS